jgi:hypothetical protein
MANAVVFRSYRPGTRIFFGFFAGFMATLTFHQLTLEVLHVVQVWPAGAYNMLPVPPFGVPDVISLAFWGGVWGIPLALILPLPYRGGAVYWIGAILFGAVLPTAAVFYVVGPLKGFPLPGVPHYPVIAVAPIVNAMWGLGTAVFLCLMP